MSAINRSYMGVLGFCKLECIRIVYCFIAQCSAYLICISSEIHTFCLRFGNSVHVSLNKKNFILINYKILDETCVSEVLE
jgi:hypothetical protein